MREFTFSLLVLSVVVAFHVRFDSMSTIFKFACNFLLCNHRFKINFNIASTTTVVVIDDDLSSQNTNRKCIEGGSKKERKKEG
jgi:hypothetical protein